MNIKGIVGNLIPIEFAKRNLRKTENQPDRDAQGGGQGGGEPPKQHRFTEDELKSAIQMLKEIPGMKQNNLQFRVERNGDRVLVFVEDSTGKVIRRIPDVELWAMYSRKQNDSARGNLLNKAL